MNQFIFSPSRKFNKNIRTFPLLKFTQLYKKQIQQEQKKRRRSRKGKFLKSELIYNSKGTFDRSQSLLIYRRDRVVIKSNSSILDSPRVSREQEKIQASVARMHAYLHNITSPFSLGKDIRVTRKVFLKTFLLIIHFISE